MEKSDKNGNAKGTPRMKRLSTQGLGRFLLRFNVFEYNTKFSLSRKLGKPLLGKKYTYIQKYIYIHTHILTFPFFLNFMWKSLH